MKSTFSALLLLVASSTAFALSACASTPPASTVLPADLAADLASYDITWNSQSKRSADSMPLSGHNLGINLWVENNDLMVLVGSPNCMDENGMQVKLGLIRLRLDQPIFAKDFKQTLHLTQSEIVVTGKTADGKDVSITFWCEAQKQVIHATLAADAPVGLTASYETWSSYAAKFKDGGITWSHRLAETNARRERDMKAQGMTEFAAQIPDPLSKLTAGGRLEAPGLIDAGQSTGKFNGMNTKVCAVKTAAPVKSLDLTLTLRMEQDASLPAWESALDAQAEQVRTQNTAQARAQARAWWAQFWNRSHIDIKPAAGIAHEEDKPWQAARNYQLIRYMLASNTSGRAMTLFNGGNFPCTGNPDVRNWDGCQFMAQNQRLVYWPMLRAGDFDMLQVATDFYRDRTDMSKSHAKKFWGVNGGVAWCEAFNIFGLGALGTTAEGRCNPKHLQYHFTSGIEFALMMLEMERYTGKEFPHYRDGALGIIAYYDQFYQKSLEKKAGKPLDGNGRLVIYPSDACEPYHGCTNNPDVVAGLRALTRTLLASPALTPSERAYLEGFKKRTPEFPMGEIEGHKFFAASATKPDWVMFNGNMDFPQMYVLFPFGELALGRGDMALAKNTWKYSAINESIQHQNQCWYQTAINFARMGKTADAARLTTAKLCFETMRFPTFYHTHYAVGGEFCHVPDTDHAGVAMTALQEMLMQTDGERILLGPAWPGDWNCSFKLHAPGQTVVEGRVAGGKVVVDRVTPESRRKNIEIFPLKTPPPPPASQGKPARASSVWGGGYEAGKAFDGDLATRWAAGPRAKAGWLAVDLGKPTPISRAVVQEISYPRVKQFVLEAQAANGAWQPLAQGTTLGADKELTFPPVTAQKFRLNILDAANTPTIDEVQLFEK